MSNKQIMRTGRIQAMTVLLFAVASLLTTPVVATNHAQDPAPPTTTPAAACVGVMAATVTGVGGNAAESGEALRDLLVSFLSGPSMQPVALESRVRIQAIEEAKQKGCAYVVTTTATMKRGGSGGFGRVLGQAAGNAAWYIPGGSGAAAAGRAVSYGTARALGDMAATTRSKDEMRLEWTVTSLAAGARPGSPRSEKLKASADGEDLLSPLVQRAAESIVETVMK
ncbi:MAG: hypothetical protein M3541_19355 [Acidobacteriota bacterium]|nr:hypothetical protein [Acidobacteriota bacterium]MDQ3420899.1 hypothetical protein [Acidobacteriota bacterium]